MSVRRLTETSSYRASGTAATSVRGQNTQTNSRARKEPRHS